MYSVTSSFQNVFLPMRCFFLSWHWQFSFFLLYLRAEDRVRHYMIDQLRNKKFIIVGEKKVHKTLKDIIEYHQNVSQSN